MTDLLRWHRPARHCTNACVLLLLLQFSASLGAATTVRLGWIGATDSAAWRGASQGLLEANAQGRFLGLNYEITALGDDSAVATSGAIALIVDATPVRLRRLADRVGDLAVINVTSDDNQLREACIANLLHTPPSQWMLDDAMQQWQRKNPQSGAVARAWHPTFKKYAAAQLNRRYTDTFAEPMSDDAWAAWAAVKLIADTLARGTPPNAAALLEALKHDLAFDGQKGTDLSFRNTGQLRQPLLLVDHDKIVGEAPVRGVASPSDLDSLGLADCLK